MTVEKAIKLIDDYLTTASPNINDVWVQALQLCKEALKNKPEGKWVDNVCTNCGTTPLGKELWKYLDITPPDFNHCFTFCPICGSKNT